MADKKTILLLPPDGSRVRAGRIRVVYLVLAGAVVAVGFAGYFIPFNRFTLDVVEQTHRKNLSDQNKELLGRYLASFKLSNQLHSQVVSLDSQKTGIDTSLKSVTARPEGQKPARPVSTSSLGLNQLDSLVGRDFNYYTRLTKSLSDHTASFDSIPVLKPIPGYAVISALFGKQRDPFTGTVKWHYGIDFSARQETPVVATASGIVESIEEDHQWGKRIEISHGPVFSTVYAHLGTITTIRGAHVKRGDVIATVGLSGLTRGPHLHYEVHKNGQAVNPADYFFPDSVLVDTSLNTGK